MIEREKERERGQLIDRWSDKEIYEWTVNLIDIPVLVYE